LKCFNKVLFELFFYFIRNSATEEGCELLVTVLEAKDLVLPPDSDPDYCDTFVRFVDFF
jgi:hypothetical protein